MTAAGISLGRNTMRGSLRVLACASLALAAGCTELPTIMTPAPEPAPAPKPAPEAVKPPSPQQVNEAFTRLNSAFQKEYERILAQRGTRNVSAQPREAFATMHAALIRLGMIVESQDSLAGTLTVAAPAPRPLSIDEWRAVVAADAPMMGAILCPVLGAYCKTIRFEPDDYVIVINATVLPAAGSASEVSLTTRMREIVPRPGVPRRDYPPPTGVHMALDKIWAGFDRELAARQRR
jgi:hypothetical protein